ncbi:MULTISPECIES: SDR family NAD(P)-dependent oxidoreductase [unclassified Helicobacter]|uniref:SDR family NAD(P)-dependent oxidoreductase n=1 Tax=unclassified Helicobacter TaxID=2593540 RepID=UPI000CF0ECC0|nr:MULTISPECIES: SDR family oxidoreductase [unclassified Helicobacter]
MDRDIVLVLGASSDIGRDLIEDLKKEALVIAHFNTGVIKEEDGIIPLHCELGNVESIENFICKILEIGIPNKIVFLASPKIENIRFKDFDLDLFHSHFNIGLRSIFMILKELLPKMIKNKEKRKKVVFMLSSCVVGMPPMALSVYVSLKYAILGLMRSLVSEYRNYNIQFNALSPSMIETKFLEGIDSRIVELNAINHPLKRNAKTKDVIPVIKMLLGEESDYINGVNIPITGGENF